MAGLAVTKEGEFGSLFHYSVSLFAFILQQKHIWDCCFFCASLSPFVRCKESEGGGESESAVGNNGSLSLQWVNGKKLEVQVTSV